MNNIIKLIIDIIMTALLLMLMSYQVFGEVLHEWFGAVMIALFLVHNILNIKWYGGLFKGKYSAVRVIWTIINIAALAGMGIMAYSGIVLSRHVFAWLPIEGGLSLARRLHLAGSYWTLIAVSLHLGLHWNMVFAKFRKLTGKKAPVPLAWIMRAAALGIAVYGAVCFHNLNAISYMFLTTHFAFLDYDKNPVLVVAEFLAIAVLWAFVSYYLTKAVTMISAKIKNSKNKKKSI